ncbi:uncharacterized protein EI90DRAFT_3295543 [Cantharellus anzutake]|uniref:uncharacterized protein n=1 Tax=Cantharellus anzutake TaxID=1750568 RepID=UPI0019051738|nr:uncharacterized protein EI90DRAFT_3295543 [Cantharellus anzutake]KAF8311109.1 hypothetical protein EI90DRAFT_3295543 [Cantharellus anzutake]
MTTCATQAHTYSTRAHNLRNSATISGCRCQACLMTLMGKLKGIPRLAEFINPSIKGGGRRPGACGGGGGTYIEGHKHCRYIAIRHHKPEDSVTTINVAVGLKLTCAVLANATTPSSVVQIICRGVRSDALAARYLMDGRKNQRPSQQAFILQVLYMVPFDLASDATNWLLLDAVLGKRHTFFPEEIFLSKSFANVFRDDYLIALVLLMQTMKRRIEPRASSEKTK